MKMKKLLSMGAITLTLVTCKIGRASCRERV